MKEYEEKLSKKNKVINDLLTESENKKTELLELQNGSNMKKAIEAKLLQDLVAMKEQMNSDKADGKLKET